MQIAYVTPNNEMQIVDKHNGSAEVYNFKSIYSDSHSHIHYPDAYDTYNKIVYRSLNNPTSDTHAFYPKPEDAQYGAIQRDSIYDFDYKFEQIRSLNLDNLTREQLEQIRDYLEFIKSELTVTERTR